MNKYYYTKSLIAAFLLFVAAVSLKSCYVQRDVTGVYMAGSSKKYPKTILATHYIELNDDSTFNYMYKVGFHEMVSSGVWACKDDGKKVYIESSITDLNNLGLCVNELKDDSGYCMFIFDNPLKSYELVKWELNIDGRVYPLNADRLILRRSSRIGGFYLTGYLSCPAGFTNIPFPLQDKIQSMRHEVKDTNCNIFHISFTDSLNHKIFYYKILKDSINVKKKFLLMDGVKMRKRLKTCGKFYNEP